MSEAKLVKLFQTETTAAIPDGLSDLSSSIMKMVSENEFFGYFQNGVRNNMDIQKLEPVIHQIAFHAAEIVTRAIPEHLSCATYIEKTYLEIKNILTAQAVAYLFEQQDPDYLKKNF